MMDAKRVILDMKYARIIELLAVRMNVSSEEAMDLFYNSPLFELIDAGVADLHCRSDEYLVEEILDSLGLNA